MLVLGLDRRIHRPILSSLSTSEQMWISKQECDESRLSTDRPLQVLLAISPHTVRTLDRRVVPGTR